jgi:Zn-dependent protease
MDIIITIVVLVYSIILHEIAHGVVALWLGDSTGKDAGRLTLNPIPHIDPIMTIAVPVLLYLSQLNVPPANRIIFGGAKGMPVNLENFKDPKADWALVALAGPATNFLLAIIGALLIKTPLAQYTIATSILTEVIILNLILAIFNLIPIPPLDGSRVLAALMPDSLSTVYLSLERFGFVFIFAFLYFHLFDNILFSSVNFFLRFFSLA